MMINQTLKDFLVDWDIAAGDVYSMCKALSVELLEVSRDPCPTREHLERWAIIADYIGHRADELQSRDCS